MKIILIRHGQTQGNRLKKYIGATDESLSLEGKKILQERMHSSPYPLVQKIFVSPMKRCIETAEIIYPGRKYILCENLRECNFGEFENKNYLELSQDENYQKWIESNGTLPFPCGENPYDFKERCIQEFKTRIADCEEEHISFVVHGGSIMSILEKYALPNKDFFSWKLENGEGYICDLLPNKSNLHVIKRIKNREEEI